MIALDEI